MARSVQERVREYYEDQCFEPTDVIEAIVRGDDDGWELLTELVRFAPNLEALATLGAGLMETFMSEDNASRHLVKVAHEVEHSAKFRYALRFSHQLPDSIEALLQTAPDDEPSFE